MILSSKNNIWQSCSNYNYKHETFSCLLMSCEFYAHKAVSDRTKQSLRNIGNVVTSVFDINISILYFQHLRKNIVEKTTKLSNLDFPKECFTDDFLQFASTLSKVVLGWPAEYFLFNFMHFRGFLEILDYRKILSLKSFRTCSGNSYIHFSVIII